MLNIENVRRINPDRSAVLDLQASTTSDLPALGGECGGFVIAAGTIAQVIQDGKFYTLDDDETWYDEDGEALTPTT